MELLNHIDLEQKIELKYMMTDVEHKTKSLMFKITSPRFFVFLLALFRFWIYNSIKNYKNQYSSL